MVVVYEFVEPFLKFGRLHLSVAYAHAHSGNVAPYEVGQLLHACDSVCYQEHLSVAAQLKADGFLYYLGIEVVYLGVDGVAVGRRCLYYGEVARSHDGELQGARYWGGGHCECIHVHLELAQLLLDCNAELLLLVNDE